MPMPVVSKQPEPPVTAAASNEGAPAFSERAVWHPVGEGWRHLHGSIRETGVSFEWHDFEATDQFDWGKVSIREALKYA